MQTRRLIFSALFLLGTVLAVIGWTGELKWEMANLGIYALIGHALQVIGIFGRMVTPDEIEDPPTEGAMKEFWKDDTA